MRLLVSVGVRAVLFALIPNSIFLSLKTLNPSWDVPHTVATTLSFWMLYVMLRIGVQSIRYSDWDFSGL